jgi:hypothetical protein
MSLGYGGKAQLSEKDSTNTFYKYGVYNWNDGQDINDMTMDGIIRIDNTCFYEPEILVCNKKHTKEKRILRDVPYEQFISDGKIEVVNSQKTWEFRNGVDVVALCLIRKILFSYQEDGFQRNELTYFV